MAIVTETLEPRRLMANFLVTTNADSGAGSLRQAIINANATPAQDTISFTLSNPTIAPTSALPLISAPLIIDGSTQPGYAGTPLVFLSGASAPLGTNGLNIQAANTTIKGLAIGNFQDNAGSGGVGIAMTGSSSVVNVIACTIGVFGTSTVPNNRGINSLTDTTTITDSVISGNESYGIRLSGNGSRVVDSIVGLRSAANPINVGNGGAGVLIEGGSGNQVIDSVISANVGQGILANTGAVNVIVDGNIIGMTPDRTGRRANLGNAVDFDGVGSGGTITDNRIASFNSATSINLRNSNGVSVQSNNVGFGVDLANPFGGLTGIKLDNADNNTIRFNQVGHQNGKGIHLINSNNNSIRRNGVGTLLDNSADLGNVGTGIHLVNSFDNKIGTDGERNAVSHNATGIHIESGERNPVLANVFKSNFQLDIDLGTFGVTGNDANDADTGANTLLNTITPVWGAYNNPSSPGFTTVSFRARSEFAAGGTYRVDFYRSDSVKSPFDIGEGSALIDSQTISMPDGLSDFLFYLDVPIEPDGHYVAATVTSLINGVPTNTSEMSEAMRVDGAPQILASQFNFESRHEVAFNFSRTVAASINNDEIIVTNLATNQTYTPSGFTLQGSNRAVWHFNTPLPNGNYRATLNRASVSSPVDIGPTQVILNAVGPNTLDFHVLAGDINRDRTVSFADLVTLAQNYGQSGRTFSQGNIDYSPDGSVGFADLVLLAQNYGSTLPALVGPSPGLRPGRQRLSDDLLA